MSGRRRRRRVEPADDWKQLVLLCGWPEQVRYEEIRPLVLFGELVAERAEETRGAERTLYRRISRFEAEGMESLFDTEKAKRRALPPRIRRIKEKREGGRLGLNQGNAAFPVARTGLGPGHLVDYQSATPPYLAALSALEEGVQSVAPAGKLRRVHSRRSATAPIFSTREWRLPVGARAFRERRAGPRGPVGRITPPRCPGPLPKGL